MAKFAAVANLDNNIIEVHKHDCRDLVKINRRFDVDILENTTATDWAITVFGEVEDDVEENPEAYVRVMPCFEGPLAK